MGLRKKILNTTVSFCAFIMFQCVNGQTDFGLTIENIKRYDSPPNKNGEYSTFYFTGMMEASPVYCLREKNEAKFFTLDEKRMQFNFFDKIEFNSGVYISDMVVQDSMLFFLKSNMEDNTDDSKGEMYLKTASSTHFLQYLNNVDKAVKASFSDDHSILSISTLSTHSDYYDSLEDDSLSFYFLNAHEDNLVDVEKRFCKYCSNPQVVEGKIFFNRATPIDDYSNAYGKTDVFVTDLGFEHFEKIASNSEILKASPDGKLLLIRRLHDLPNNPVAVLNVEDRMYALLLGRDYYSATAFYSETQKCFAFDFKGKVTYVQTPSKFPFDALNDDNPKLEDLRVKKQLQKLKHPPFEN